MDLFGYISDRAMVMYDVVSFVKHLKYYVVMLAVRPDIRFAIKFLSQST